jgi:CO/xanthine dehydrogenase FAD-binding subunit
MIVEYHRPEKLDDALRLLSRKEIKTVPLGGGTVVNAPSADQLAVVDLQALGLNQIQERGGNLVVGATATLQSLLEWPGLLEEFARVIRHEATYNLRQVATLAGALLAADGRSPFAAALMALDAKASLLPGEEQYGIGDLLFQRGEKLRGRLVTQITLPLNVQLSYQYVARTPADLPIVSVIAVAFPSGRLRLVLGGYGNAPILALDGPEGSGAQEAAESAYNDAQDEWASAEYRRATAGILARRCIKSLSLT